MCQAVDRVITVMHIVSQVALDRTKSVSLRSGAVSQKVGTEEDMQREAERFSTNSLGNDHAGHLALVAYNALKPWAPVNGAIWELMSAQGYRYKFRALPVYREHHC
jgi:hypothetical protein